MKALKLFILVSVFGFFTACGGGAKTEETQTETPAAEAPAAEAPAAPADSATTAPADSAAAPATNPAGGQ